MDGAAPIKYCHDDLRRTTSTYTTKVAKCIEITRYLFRNGKETGQDLRAIDIQRGRDHGLASYNDYRHYCGLHRADKFSDFGDYISQENIVKLSHLYEHPDDVDYVVGGSLEAHVNGALSGPSFLCVMVEQFYRTRAGDKFFYENGDHHHSFTHVRSVRHVETGIDQNLSMEYMTKPQCQFSGTTYRDRNKPQAMSQP
uniref:Peroxidase n=2 Tax=Timema TaxID=61471 RepID=A0A7R9IFR2_9NEOP|nr:unnamed protein product [Timema bartmani]CAD7457602.1 unnamed protein product [Timema tahoe]